MPALEVADLRQYLVLWAFGGTYDAYARPNVGDPSVVRCRWEWGRRTSISPDGTPLALDATIFVAQELPLGSRVWLLPAGVAQADAYSYWTGTGSPEDDYDVLEVASDETIPDLKNRVRQRTYGARRWKDSPTNNG